MSLATFRFSSVVDDHSKNEVAPWRKLCRRPFVGAEAVVRGTSVNIKAVQMDPVSVLVVSSPKTGNSSLHRYCVATDEWRLLMGIDDELEIGNASLAMGEKTNSLYAVLRRGEITKIDIKTCSLEVIYSDACLEDAQIAFIKGELHLIGGFYNIKHLIWNPKKQEFEAIHTFTEWKRGAIKFQLIYIESQNVMLMLGGSIMDDQFYRVTDEIWTYNIEAKQWGKACVRVPTSQLEDFHVMKTWDEQHIILFGGRVARHYRRHGCAYVWKREIHVLNLETMIWRESSIKLPYTNCHVAGLRNREQTRLLVSGYISLCCKQPAMPVDIVDLIEAWFLEPRVLAFDQNSTKCSFIPTDELLLSKDEFEDEDVDSDGSF